MLHETPIPGKLTSAIPQALPNRDALPLTCLFGNLFTEIGENLLNIPKFLEGDLGFLFRGLIRVVHKCMKILQFVRKCMIISKG